MTTVQFRNSDTPASPALTGEQISSMCGQTARLLSRTGDHTRPLGKVTVISTAPLDGDLVRLGIEVSSPYGPDVLSDGSLVGIGFIRESDTHVRLMDMGPDPGPPAIPLSALTGEQRQFGREMMHECAYEVPQPPGHYPDKMRCRATATSVVHIGDAWYFRCTTHEGWVSGQVDLGEVRPITLVPTASSVQHAEARWITTTPWWRHADEAGDLQRLDYSGRDFYDVLVVAHGADKAAEMWAEACALDPDAPASYRERIGMGPSGPLGEALLAGETVHADPERGFADGGLITTPLADASKITSGAITTDRIRPIVAKYDTEAECERHGGHCWESDGMKLLSSPPQYPEHCKHCPATRVGTPRSPMSYRYPDGRVE